jgi:hypothetical protein
LLKPGGHRITHLRTILVQANDSPVGAIGVGTARQPTMHA